MGSSSSIIVNSLGKKNIMDALLIVHIFKLCPNTEPVGFTERDEHTIFNNCCFSRLKLTTDRWHYSKKIAKVTMLWLSINYVQLPYCPHGHECRDKFRIFNEFSELFFFQSGMILQQELGGQACVYFGLSLIHTGSERNV